MPDQIVIEARHLCDECRAKGRQAIVPLVAEDFDDLQARGIIAPRQNVGGYWLDGVVPVSRGKARRKCS